MQSNLNKYKQKQSYQQPPIPTAMCNTQRQMVNIMNSPQLTPDEKSALYSNELNRFKRFKILNSPTSSKLKFGCKKASESANCSYRKPLGFNYSYQKPQIC
jgi:hypothetical protein